MTIEPVYGERFALFEECCKTYNFRAAELLMQKLRADTPIRSSKDSFCTGHDRDYSRIHSRTLALVADLKDAGFEVWRYKIEGIVTDVKFERLVKIREKE